MSKLGGFMYKIKNSNKGFTLLELLVVVLIIGILAAIALPQYRLAVDKAKFSNFQRLVKSIKSSFDNYYLIHNEYPISFDGLDIDFSSSYEHKIENNREGCVIFEDSYCCVGKPISGTQKQNIVCGKNDYTFAYMLYGNELSLCVAANENSRAQRLCQNYSSSIYSTGNLITPFGHNRNNGKHYTLYKSI